MAAFKIIILCGLLAVALGFTIPEEHLENPSSYNEAAFGEESAYEGGEVLIRSARSPQRQIQAGMEHHQRHGTSANVQYTHPIGKNMDAYAGASRNFKYNDNSGHVGLRYKF